MRCLRSSITLKLVLGHMIRGICLIALLRCLRRVRARVGEQMGAAQEARNALAK